MTLVSVPANPVPDGAIDGIVTTPDGVALRYARWPAGGARKGTVCVFTGRGECIEKYFETIRELRSRGFAVVAMDWRGQGHSARELRDWQKGHVRRFSDFEIDAETLIQEIVLPDCPPPFFALAHSMGGAVMLRLAHSGTRWFDRIVLSAPMIGLPPRIDNASVRLLAKLLRAIGRGGHYVPGGGPALVGTQAFAGNDLTSDPVRYARNASIVAEDPTLGIASPTIGWLNTAFQTMQAFRDPAFPGQIRQPILIVAAGGDRVVSNAAIESFAFQLRGGAHLVIPGAQHEILQEQDRYRQQFWAAFDSFVPGTPLF